MFEGLNEAVVAEIEKKYLPEMVEHNDETKDEWKWLQTEEAFTLKQKIAHENEIQLSEIVWINRGGKDYRTYPYGAQRQVLTYVVNSIWADGGFESREEVLNLFFQGHFNGKLLKIARCVEKSFGKGSFRMLAGMSKESNSAWQMLEQLKKKRRLLAKHSLSTENRTGI